MNFLERARKWVSGVEPQGLGTLFVGLAAICALFQTSSILDRILKIQEQAGEIKTAVDTLRKQSSDLATAVALLGEQLKKATANQTVDSSKALSEPKSPTKEQVEKALEAIPFEPLEGQPTIFLSGHRREHTVEMIRKAQTPEQRATILQNNLEYAPALKFNGGLPASSGH